MIVRRASYLLALLTLLLAAACSSSNSASSSTPFNSGGASQSGSVPVSSHVVIVVEENQSYEDVIGNPSMPYLNGLASRYGLATQFYANTHPSIGNYFMLTTGQIISNDDAFSGTISADNIFRQLILSGKSWKSYAESLPGVGYTGDNVDPYVKRHNPAAYMSDVIGTAQALNLVPFTQFSSNLASGQLPNFSFVVPNQTNNAHDCPGGGNSCTDAEKLARADAWLEANIGPLLSNASFQQDGILIVVFDESKTSDTAFGGGHIVAIVAGPRIRSGYRSTQRYQFDNLLRTLSKALGLPNSPGTSAGAADMGEFFK